MAKRFGLDWQEYDATRMAKFIAVMSFEYEEKAKRAKKSKSKGKFRPKA